MITDTETTYRRAMCRAVQPDPIAVAVRDWSASMQPMAIEFRLLQRKLCGSRHEARRAVLAHYPWK